MIERILVPGIMEPVSHYCHVVQAGPHVWVSGVVGMDGNGDVPQGVVAQFDLAIDVMDQMSESRSRRSRTRCKGAGVPYRHQRSPRDQPAPDRLFGDHRPASTLVEVALAAGVRV